MKSSVSSTGHCLAVESTDWEAAMLHLDDGSKQSPHFIRDPDARHYAVRSRTNADNNGWSYGRPDSMDTQLLVKKLGKYRGSSD